VSFALILQCSIIYYFMEKNQRIKKATTVFVKIHKNMRIIQTKFTKLSILFLLLITIISCHSPSLPTSSNIKPTDITYSYLNVPYFTCHKCGATLKVIIKNGIDVKHVITKNNTAVKDCLHDWKRIQKKNVVDSKSSLLTINNQSNVPIDFGLNACSPDEEIAFYGGIKKFNKDFPPASLIPPNQQVKLKLNSKHFASGGYIAIYYIDGYESIINKSAKKSLVLMKTTFPTFLRVPPVKNNQNLLLVIPNKQNDVSKLKFVFVRGK